MSHNDIHGDTDTDTELDVDAGDDTDDGNHHAASGDAGNNDAEGDAGGPTATNDTPADVLAATRRQAAAYRRRLRESERRADDLAGRLFTERVAALGILADPADLPYDAALLDDVDALRDAAEALVAERPHLRARTLPTMPAPDAGSAADVSLMGLLRGA